LIRQFFFADSSTGRPNHPGAGACARFARRIFFSIIDSPLHRQDQLLAEFTDKDRSEIGWRLQITMNGQAATQLRDQDA